MITRLWIGVALTAAVASQSMWAQMQPLAPYEGKLLPIAAYHDEHLTVLENGKKRLTYDRNITIRPGTEFAEGMVEIAHEKSDLDPLRDAPAKKKTDPSAVRFRYEAEVVADRNLSDCYALLSFVSEGSVGTQLVTLGRLSAGQPKAVKVELRSRVSLVGSLHVFSRGLEVRSSQHREAYDVLAFYDALVKRVKGISAAELFKLEDVYPHVISRDGKRLATIRQRDARKSIIVYDLESMKLICDVTAARSSEYLADLTWISADEIAYISTDENTGIMLRMLDSRTSKITNLKEDITSIIRSLREKPEVLVLHQAKFGSLVMKYDVRTRKAFDFEDPDAGSYIFDRHGNARVMARHENDKVTYKFRPTPDARWQDLDAAVKHPGLRFNLRAADLLDRTADLHSLGPNGDTLYISTRLGTDRFELAAFSMAEGVIKQVIAKSPKYDMTKADGGISRLLFAKDTDQLIGIIYEAQKPKVAWLDPTFANLQKSIDATFPDHVNIPLDWSDDAQTIIYFSMSDQDPGTYYAFRPAKPELITMLKLSDRLEGRKLGKTSPIEFTARDGQKIPAYVTRPPDHKGPAPLIVSIHGGPTVRDSWRFDAENQFFATRGYVVLQVNYRGSSGYGAAFQNAGLRARLDTVIIDDIADGVRFLIAQGEVDPARVAVMGGSFGGWATYLSLIRYPELYRAGVAIAAVSNWRKTLRDDRWRFSNQMAYRFWKALLDEQNFSEHEKFIDPLLRSGEIKKPVFIIHGENDTIVHPTEAKLMLEALRKHNPNVQARSFPAASHAWWPYDDRVQRTNEIAAFLEQHLAPAGPPEAIASQ